jgi:hypothetical protein
MPARRFRPDTACMPAVVIEMVPLCVYDEFGTVRQGRMNTTDPIDAARLELLLVDLRLSAIKLPCSDLAARADTFTSAAIAR